jgi:FkbM family methyltransferase
MLTKIPESLRWSIGVHLALQKVIHVGANFGQEVDAYEEAGIAGYHVEAHPEYLATVAKLCAGTLHQTAVEGCCDAVSGRTVEFNVTSNTQSSSMLPLGRHATAYPSITVTKTIKLVTTTVDDLVQAGRLPADADFLLIDVQGAEANVLAGARKLLESGSLWGLQVEVALDALYDGGVSFESLYTQFLKPAGYFLKDANFNNAGWTDALFLKRWWRLPNEEVAPLWAVAHAQRDLFGGPILRAFREAEAQGAVSIGPQGRCSQSTLSQWSTAEGARAAVMENLTGGFAIHTDKGPDSWWMVEWDEPRRIDEILCFNRIDCGQAMRDRIIGAVIEFTPDGTSWKPPNTVTATFGGLDGHPLRVETGAVMARAIRLRQPRADYLHFDHIRIVSR